MLYRPCFMVIISGVLTTCATLPPEAVKDPPPVLSNQESNQVNENNQLQVPSLQNVPQRKGKLCNPDVDFSLDCQFRAAECRIVSYILHGIDGGLMSNLLYCSSVLAITLDTNRLLNSSVVLQNSTVSTLDLIDHTISNEADKTRIRRCILQGSRLIKPNGKLDRTSIAKRFQTHLFWTSLSTALSKAVFSCPEPKEFEMRSFFRCLRDVCIENAPGIVEIFIPTDPSTGMMLLDLNTSDMPTSPPFLAGGLVY